MLRWGGVATQKFVRWIVDVRQVICRNWDVVATLESHCMDFGASLWKRIFTKTASREANSHVCIIWVQTRNALGAKCMSKYKTLLVHGDIAA